MRAWLNFNGKFKAEGLPLISADNRGFRYGDGIFETIKTCKEEICHWDLHAARLFKGIATLGLSLPALLTKDELRKQILLTLARNKIDGFGRIRLTVFRGDGGLFETEGKGGGYLIQAWPLEQQQVEFNSNGLIVGLYEDGRKSCDALSSLKSNNYLLSVMAAMFAQTNKLNDAIFLNNYGRICESSIANVFWIKHNTIYTVPLTEGCVAGVMRQHLIDNFTVTQKSADVSELETADELFFTNAVFGIRWVSAFRQATYANNVSKEIFESISR